MCGFSGYIDKKQAISDSASILAMLKLQEHRGPDDQGILGIQAGRGQMTPLATDQVQSWPEPVSLVFGFNRLSILDLSEAGHQPMCSSKEGVALMMNGEVYNAFDYKRELEQLGYVFEGKSDTEVVLYLYLAFGLEGMLERLNGMFALAIYDARQKALFLVRDRVGIKPLYLLRNERYLAFASEMKSFKALPQFKFSLDQAQLSEFLLFRNSINQTLFEDIVNLEPGTYCRIDAEANCQFFTYYDLRQEGRGLSTLGQADLEKALRQSVKSQMISDVKLGSQLSGGVDSSLVTAYAAESLASGALETVSIVFDQASFSEKKYIDAVAARYKLRSHQYKLDASAYLDLLDEAIWHFEQPINHPNTIGIKLLSREAKKQVTVLLSGEGADESLAGYSRFLPPNARLWQAKNLKRLWRNRGQWATFWRYLKQADSRYILETAFGGFASVAALYPQFSASEAMAQRQAIWRSIQDQPGRKKRKYELLSYLPDLLMRQDKMSMAHSIENRVPFLDNAMLAVAMRLPDHELIKMRQGRWEGKYPLKELCAQAFEPDFAYRTKMGFGIPLKDFFASDPFQQRWQAEILPGIQRRGLFNTGPLKAWMAQPLQMNNEQIDALWLMLSFEIWAQSYLD